MTLRSDAKIVFAFVFATLIVFACKEEKKETKVVVPRVFPGYHILLDEIIRSPLGVFRGTSLNAKSEDIRKLEKEAPVEDSDGHIYYEYRADSLTDYSIDYTFLKDSLEEISVQI